MAKRWIEPYSMVNSFIHFHTLFHSFINSSSFNSIDHILLSFSLTHLIANVILLWDEKLFVLFLLLSKPSETITHNLAHFFFILLILLKMKSHVTNDFLLFYFHFTLVSTTATTTTTIIMMWYNQHISTTRI